MHVQTQAAADWWARPRGGQSASWIANYQQSLTTRHRLAISQIVREVHPARLLEVGCHCGPNLMRIALDHPTVQCAGIDANAEAIAAGQQWMAQQGFTDRVVLNVGRFPEATAHMASGAVDVVLSCYSLAYVSPADLDAALYELGRLATTAVILAEPMRGDAKHTMSGYTEWHHDYEHARSWVKTLNTKRTRTVPIAPPVDALTTILILET